MFDSYSDLNTFLEIVNERRFFDRDSPVIITRAPGRLDVMGGIADYSGSLVLQRPIAEATFVAIQRTSSDKIEIVSLGSSPESTRRVVLERSAIVSGGAPIDYPAARQFFSANPEMHWASYVAGPLLVLQRERRAAGIAGLRILIQSNVPEGKGVASSAALEVASMMAIAEALDLHVDPPDIALLSQHAENLVAGAACGVMDQMTAVFGEADSLLALVCRPAILDPPVAVPPQISFWGIDSGERHAIGGDTYESVRTGAFMGRRILSASRPIEYLAMVSPADYEREFQSLLPVEISGSEFLSRYGETGDSVTRVVPSRTYRVRQPAAHPIYENARVHRFRELLRGPQGEEQWTSMGELMYQSHASYSACGLGSAGTDLLVALVHKEGVKEGLYGARITGGGSGGTVAILARSDAQLAVMRIAEYYSAATGYKPLVFSGTSHGASKFGALKVNFK